MVRAAAPSHPQESSACAMEVRRKPDSSPNLLLHRNPRAHTEGETQPCPEGTQSDGTTCQILSVELPVQPWGFTQHLRPLVFLSMK